ncbi:MAG: DUF1549 domain-containing protein [Planctomycetes bacterium]|nr:DUF1549 domain-containing protein [Planctomycetota bacterium]
MIITVALLLLTPCSMEAAAEPIHFENDILPILGRHGCNSSGCHGKAEGQGGFKLSVLGSDPEADLAAIIKEGRGRRVVPSAPDESLLLRKASGRVAHGGGVKLQAGAEDYATVRSWINAGAPMGSPDAPKVVSIRVVPESGVMAPGAGQTLKVMARFSDNREKDVTRHARFQSNAEAVAAVDATGLVRTLETPGEAAVMAGYLGEVAVFRVMVPRPGKVAAGAVPFLNEIDRLVDAKLARLNIAPSGLCGDSEFLRRVHIDLCGVLPTPAAARKFLADTRPDKRVRLVDELLQRPEHADLWAMRWADLLRVDREALGHQQASLYHGWIRSAVAGNMPLDRFAKSIVASDGPPTEVGPANFLKVLSKPGDAASAVSQVFLGVRITCAECHHHPFDKWRQSDYHGMAAHFTASAVSHPRTRKVVHPHPLGAEMPTERPKEEPRVLLAEWMATPGNPYFSRNLANRIWAWMTGRGIVEPVDDFRATNPPVNPELLDFLALRLEESRFDARSLIRLVAASRVYQASAAPNETNKLDERNFSRSYLRRPEAEVTLDIICQALGVGEKFQGSPLAERATQVWDSKARHEFLKKFGRPSRVTACECERTKDPSVAQVLSLLNSSLVHDKLSHDGGTVARLAEASGNDARLVEDLYMVFLSRQPTPAESASGRDYLSGRGRSRRAAAEDLAWALLNSGEFLFNH